MVQPSSWPPPIASPIPSQLPPQPPVMGGGCDGCKLVLTTEPGFTQSVCHICALSQILPADGIRANQVQAHGVDPTKIQLPCANCKAIVSVAHGSSSLNCPRCLTNISVDSSKIGKVLPPVSAPPPLEEVNEVVSEVEREEDEGGVAGETFTDYRPSKLSIGPPHPDPIVETSSLSAVQPPIPTYSLKIKDNLEISKALSCLQIEAMVYACQRHLHHLPDGARAGFLLGDGAGVGKGRTIAGLIWENWNHGRRKTLWISVGSDLLYDAQRDLNDVGATCIKVHALNKLPYSKLDSNALKVRDGVVFLTYTSLIACNEKGHSRLNQLVQWFGGQFDGLLVFDECHKAKNLVPEAGLKPTKTGEAVLEIQAKLLQARVVYCSATGASEPRNLGYMTRLGLWGAGTAFIDFSEFLVAMEKWGVGALELVAMDMKARGMYVCRTLSYKAAEFEVVEVSLDNKMMDMYGKATEFWVQLRLDLISASAHVAHAPAEKMLLWRLHWANHQRFFRHMCMSAKVPAVIRLSEKALVENKCVVIGLQSTGEARTEEAITKYGLELDDFISGPRELLLNFVERYYPLPDKPEPLPERTVIGLRRKRGPAMPDAALTETVAKVVKLNYASEEETDSQSESDAEPETESDDEEYCPLSDKPEPLLEGTVIRLCRKRGPTMPNASLSERVTKAAKWNDESEEESELQSETDSEPETESDDELWICNVCITGEDRKKLLQCSCCNQFFHPACLIPPVVEVIFRDWSCYSCKEKMEEEARARQADYEERLKRYEAILERKVKIIEKIQSLDLPTNPLDDIIDQLGGPDKVAEITGRRGMLVRASEGKGVIYLARNTKDVTMEMVNMHEKKLFMDGKKLIAIISEAGSAGVSLQADRRAGNQKRRVHLTIELPWSADRAIQQFGRTHRSNQTSAPQYRLLFTNLGGECRFASIVAKRLERLGALTQGDRRAGPSLNTYNYDSVHGKRALGALYRGLMEEESFPVVPQGYSSLDKFDSIEDFILKGKTALVSVGIIKDSGSGKEPRKISGYISDKDMHDVGRFLNRLLGMAPEIQKRLFESFVSIFDILIEKARVEGHFDCGIVNMRANIVQLQGTPKTVHVDSMSGASTMLYTFTLDRGMTWESASAMLEEKQRDKSVTTIAGYYESKREWMGKRHIILAIEDSASKRCKIYRPATGESIREMSLADLKVKYRKVSASKNVCRRWDYENDASSKQCMHGPNCKLHKFCTVGRRLQEVNVLCGLILPIWGNIVKVLSEQARVSHRQIRIVHIETTSDSKRIVGLLVPNAAVESLLRDLSWVQDSVDQ